MEIKRNDKTIWVAEESLITQSELVEKLKQLKLGAPKAVEQKEKV
jgi:hypothetical protein